MTKVAYCRPGNEALAALETQIRAVQAEDPLAPVTVIVDSDIAAIHLRRRLAERTTGLLNVRFTPLQRVITLLAEFQSAVRRIPLSQPCQLLAVRQAIKAGTNPNRGTIKAYARTFRSVRAHQINVLGTSLEHSYPQFLAAWQSHFIDKEGDLVLAFDSLRTGCPALSEMGAIIVLYPVVSCPLEEMFFQYLTERATFLLSPAYPLPAWVTLASPEKPLTDLSFAVLSDARSEAHYACREVMRLARNGVPFNRLAILFGRGSSLKLLTECALKRAGVPFHGEASYLMAHAQVGRFVRSWLSLATQPINRNRLFEFLRTCPHVDVKEVDNWERQFRKLRLRETSEEWIVGLNRSGAAEIVAFLVQLREDLTNTGTTYNDLVDWLLRAMQRIDLESLNTDQQAHFEAIVERIATLRQLDVISDEADLSFFSGCVEDLLMAPLPQASRYGSGVFVGTIDEAHCLDFDHLFILGLNEGDLPAPPKIDPLLPEDAIGDQKRDEIALNHALLLAPSVTLSTHKIDRDLQRESHPSRWYLEKLGEKLSKPVYADDLSGLRQNSWFHFSVSTFEELTQFEPQSLADATLQNALYAPPSSPHETKLQTPDLLGRVWSATALERLSICPYRFYLQDVIGIQEPSRPAEPFSYDGGERGNLVHRVLGQYVNAIRDLGGTVDQDQGLEIMRPLIENAFAKAEVSDNLPEPILWQDQKRRLQIRLEEFVEFNTQLATDFAAKPRATESEFELDLVLTNAKIRVKGRIDRFDVGDFGHVIDYKTSQTGFEGFSKDPFCGGELFQIPLYALIQSQVIRNRVDGHYLQMNQTDGWKKFSIPFDESNKEKFGKLLESTVELIQEAVFPMRPGDEFQSGYKNCQFCPFDRVCPRDRAERWADAKNLRVVRGFAEARGEL